MATNANWPKMCCQVAFNGGLLSTGLLTWTDITTRMLSLQADRGRQYELDEVQAGVGKLVLANLDEALNPTNPSSAYYPNVVPYRPISVLAQWPPTAIGAAVNLYNNVYGQGMYDPSFETTAVGSTPTNVSGFGSTNPVVTNTLPQFGSNSLTWTVTGGGGVQGAAFTVYLIPGNQYTVSVYVRQTAANSTKLFSPDFATTSTATTTTGAYVRLSMTFTATQRPTTLEVGSTIPSLNSTVNVDGFQVEEGASASTFTTSGPFIFGVVNGYVERWPSKWNYQGLYGYGEITTVDSFAALASAPLHTEIRQGIMDLSPTYYWPLNESTGATTFGEASGGNGPNMLKVDGKYGPATSFSAGQSTDIAGDPSGVGVEIKPPQQVYNGGVPTSLVEAGYRFTNPLSIPVTTFPSGFTFHMFIKTGTSPINGEWDFFGLMDNANNTSAMEWYLKYDGTTFTYTFAVVLNNNGGATIQLTNTGTTAHLSDGVAHQLVFTGQFTSNTSVTINMYVDGTNVGSTTGSPTSGTWAGDTFTNVMVGGVTTPGGGATIGGLPDCVYSHVAVWNRVLSTSELSNLYFAGIGNVGDATGDRIYRYAFPYVQDMDIDPQVTYQTTLAASDVTEGQTALDACQNINLAEMGDFYVNSYGILVFRGRHTRYLTTTPQWVVGENQAGGEYPYEADVAYDFDATLVYNDIEITQVNGVVATSSDTTSQTSYGFRQYQRTVNTQDAATVQDQSDWILYTHKDPLQRVAHLVVRPSANPALWPFALGAEIGDRVTVKRRTTAGYTMTSDYFIEQVSHNQSPDEWTVQFQMSPASKYQVWILDDTTYSVLDSTTRMAF